MDVIGVISLVLAVLAMVVALWHVHSIHNAAKRLDEVQRSLSTRYIGQFPEFFPEIVSLIKSAKHDITILCDSPAYACFSDPSTFLDYQQTLKRKAQEKNMTITFTCSGPIQRSKTATDQFPDQEWDKRKKVDPIFNERLENFLSFHLDPPTANDLKNPHFLELIKETEQETLRDSLLRANTRQIEVYIPLHFWLIDKDMKARAIFAFPEETIEYGFTTTDPKLISALVVMRDHYHRSNPEAQVEQIPNRSNTKPI